MLTAAKFTVEVTEEAYVAGLTEDGHPFTAPRYRVATYSASGRCWLHRTTFDGAVAGFDEDGWPTFADVRADAKAKASRLAARVAAALAAGRALTAAHWDEGRPAYGSPYYQQHWRELAAADDLADREVA